MDNELKSHLTKKISEFITLQKKCFACNMTKIAPILIVQVSCFIIPQICVCFYTCKLVAWIKLHLL